MMACIRFVHPSTVLVAGPTMSGKTQLVKQIILQQMLSKPIDNIYWCYSEWQPAYTEIASKTPAHLEFIQGLPDNLYESISSKTCNLLIIDDLMSEAGNRQLTTDLFTKGSHHRNLTVLLISQNLFHKGKEFRGVSLNSNYIIVFKNPRDRQQIKTFAQQVRPGNAQFVLDAFEDATSEPHGYLVFDFRPETPEELRIRTSILPTDNGTTVYLPAKTDDCPRKVFKPRV